MVIGQVSNSSLYYIRDKDDRTPNRRNILGGEVAMKRWVRILPLFVVVCLARQICEKFDLDVAGTWHLAFEDVLVKKRANP